jgi:putative ATP-dependent endonuclease of OLD family
MKIHHIHAKNYRTLRDTIIKFESNYCAISGHNNAGKSCVVRLILHLLSNSDATPWRFSEYSISYDVDKTQWLKDNEDISIEYNLSINRADDSALVAIVEKLSTKTFGEEELRICVKLRINSDNAKASFISVNGSELDNVSRREFLKTLRSSNNLLSHNSTANTDEFYMARGRPTVMYDFFLSQKDRKSMAQAEGVLQRQAKKVARDHKTLLSSMLAKLKDNFDVEFSMPDVSSSSRRMPLQIALSDRSVEVPLTSWGSGTQNRTHVLLSILRASRIRSREAIDNRTTPIVLVEEPESFLHPSAQAEFGTVLQALSEEESIQIIVSTHSPFMLNQSSPKSNILLKRLTQRGKTLETIVEDTSGSEWMKPFADHLGVIPDEFKAWRDVIASSNKCLLLVEGDLDKEYIEFLRSKFPSKFPLPHDVKVLAYGGRGSLKNATVISFVKQVVPKVFITFDLDAKTEVQRHLEQIGLEEKKDFLAVGKDRPGKKAIEGLLPEKVLQAVYGREVGLVSALADVGDERKSARSALKKKLLEEFIASEDYSESDLKDFEMLGRAIAKALS